MVEKIKFVQWLSAKGLSNSTKNKYAYYFDNFNSQEFTQDFVNIYLSEKEHKNPNHRAFITNLKEFLINQYPEEASYNKIQIPKRSGRKERKLPDYPTEEELLKIEEQLGEERNKLMLLISFYAGLRPMGMLNLRAIDFDWKVWKENPERPCKFKVTEKGEKERFVFIPSEVMNRLSNWIKSSRLQLKANEILWGIKYRRWHFFLTEASKKALGRSISPHKLRHGGATWLLRNGWTLQEIQEFLGHESIATTQIYAHLDKDKMMSKYEML